MLTPLLEEKIKTLLESLGFNLYDIALLKENDHQILRICITQEGGKISLDDCQRASLAVSPLLDVEMPEFEGYYLEVSSPGIERILKTHDHFKGAINELVKIKTLDRREFKGKLLNVNEETLNLEGDILIPIAQIKKAQTYFEW